MATTIQRPINTLSPKRVQSGRASRLPAARPRAAYPGVVHITAECWPFARTGGLGEAVSTLASVQAARGAAVSVILPLYRGVRETTPALTPIGAPFDVPLGPRMERARILRAPTTGHGVRVFFVEHNGFFDRAGLYGERGADYADNELRFAFFCRAALESIPLLAPDAAILHAHDWHAAPALIRLAGGLHRDSGLAAPLATVLTVHNAAFQGNFPRDAMDVLGLPATLFNWRTLEQYGRVNLLKGAIALANAIVTVSPTHAAELTTVEGGFGLHDTFAAVRDRLSGILNGIDPGLWNPATDPLIDARYSAADVSGKRRCKVALQRAFRLPVRPDVPVIAMCARLTEQKGVDLVLGAVPAFPQAQVIIVGEGDARYGEAVTALAHHHPERVAVDLTFRDATEHLLLAGADMVVIPSRYEPCGLTQMRAQRYGAIPIARRVGGLADSVCDGVTGFLFDEYSTPALVGALTRGLEAYAHPTVWERYTRAAMAQDFAWDRSVERYRDVYRDALARQRAASGATPR